MGKVSVTATTYVFIGMNCRC